MSKKLILDRSKVQLAHDVLHAIVAREVDLGLSGRDLCKFHVAHDVLSWVLCGPCGDKFNAILEEILREAERRGYALERVQ